MARGRNGRWDTVASVATFIFVVAFWVLVGLAGYHAFVAGQVDPCTDVVGGQCIP